MKKTLLILGGVLLALYLLTGVMEIQPGQRGVVRRFGRVVDTPGPGLRIGLPWGIDRVDRIAVDKVRRVRVGFQPEAEDIGRATPPGQLLTGDHNLVNLQAMVDYVVRDVEEFQVAGTQVDPLIERAAEAALAEWVSARTVDDVLLAGKATLPEWLVVQTQKRIEPYRLGVRIQSASIAQLLPPREVQGDFENVAKEQTRIGTVVNDAQQKQEQALRVALADKFRSEQLTEAYVNERTQLAQTEADAFAKRLEQYQRLRKDNPDILASIWWDQMSKVFLKMKSNGRIDLLDNHLAGDALDISLFFPQTPKK